MFFQPFRSIVAGFLLSISNWLAAPQQLLFGLPTATILCEDDNLMDSGSESMIDFFRRKLSQMQSKFCFFCSSSCMSPGNQQSMVFVVVKVTPHT